MANPKPISCPKCGGTDVKQSFHAKGDTWADYKPEGKSQSLQFATDYECDFSCTMSFVDMTAKDDCFANYCQGCGWKWASAQGPIELDMGSQATAKKEPLLVSHKGQACRGLLEGAKDLREFIEIAQPKAEFWAMHQREPFTEIAENLALFVHQRCETLRQQWIQGHPDANIDPMPRLWCDMRPWLFDVSRRLHDDANPSE